MDRTLQKEKEMNINQLIREKWEVSSYDELAKLTGLSPEAVRARRRRLGLPVKAPKNSKLVLTPEKAIERDQKLTNLGGSVKLEKSKNKLLLERLEDLEGQLEAMKVVGDANSFTIPLSKRDTSSATAVAVASDWHIAESVHSANVNGLNEFNLKVAERRAQSFFQNVVRLVKLFGEASHINTLVLALLGDFINGQLREEAMENNSLRPMDEMLQAREWLRVGIEYILNNTEVNLVIPCHSGNHARVTKKIHWSTEAGNSLEYAMYHVLARDFIGNKRVQFIIPTSYHSYVDAGGFTIRFHHGHAIKYGGGIGGLFVPAFKAISQWQKARHADLDVFGHFHQSKDGGNFLCNGSLIGFNEYAVSIKADFERPKQTFFLVDQKRKEKTVTTPVFLE